MTEEQENLLIAIRDAINARPERPDYNDYINGKLSRDEYHHLYFQYELVNEIRNGLDGELW